jgi:sugar-specific transcriptional regulator TrmB
MSNKSDLLNKALAQLGLDELESQVYGELLNVKELNIKALANKFGSNRMRIYQILDKLQSLGLLKYTKGFSRTFSLESPNKILGLLKFQETEAIRVTSDFEKYLPDLITSFFDKNQKPTLKVFEGKIQFLAIFNQILDELKEGDLMMSLGEGEDFNDIIGLDYFNKWIKKRVEKKIYVRALPLASNRFFKKIAPYNKEQLREFKFLPANFKLSEGNLFVLPHKIIIWNTVQVQVVVIENKALSDFFGSIINSLWYTLPEFIDITQ